MPRGVRNPNPSPAAQARNERLRFNYWLARSLGFSEEQAYSLRTNNPRDFQANTGVTSASYRFNQEKYLGQRPKINEAAPYIAIIESLPESHFAQFRLDKEIAKNRVELIINSAKDNDQWGPESGIPERLFEAIEKEGMSVKKGRIARATLDELEWDVPQASKDWFDTP